MDTYKFLIRKIWDMHVHLRDDDTLGIVAPITARDCACALVMPNLTPPIRIAHDVRTYRDRILAAAGTKGNFRPLMTFKILPDTDPRSIEGLLGVEDLVAGKIYPKGLTTNADDGVEDFFALGKVYEVMEKHDLVLCLHGELPGRTPELKREQAFLRTLKFIARTFPGLRIVLEHITTAAAVDAVLSLPNNVAATITVHHLLLTHDDVVGAKLHPHHFCKPVAKMRKDRTALRKAALSGCPKFFFGSDSAPHPRGAKECADCCAGIFTAPVALPLLAEFFEKHGALERLEAFVRNFAVRFYQPRGLGSDDGELLLVKHPWKVPEEIGGIVPFYAGKEISWRVEEKHA